MSAQEGPRGGRAGGLPPVIFVMGVAGSGKSMLGRALAAATGAIFLEGDDFHPPENRAAMAAGHPLSDAQRGPWLQALGSAAAQARLPQGHADKGAPGEARGQRVIVACSALKRAYRARLRELAAPCRFLFLAAPEAALAERLSRRHGHFFPAALLSSQFATLEPPGAEERDVLTLDALAAPDVLLAQALAATGLAPRP